MTNERTYGEDEVREIFDRAVREVDAAPPALSEETGLTLGELQEVGREIGVDPGRIAQAARALDTRREALPRGRSLGMPVSVGRVIELPRAVTDPEWALMVDELRDTFRARGRVATHGGVREWSNGNLSASLEPTPTGHRLRLTTLKGTARALNIVGVVGLLLGLVVLTASVLSGDLASLRTMVFTLFSAGTGVGALAVNLRRLPRWARTREGQMEHLAGRVAALLAEGPEEETSGA